MFEDKRILAIDDYEPDRIFFQETIMECGFAGEVVLASSAEEANDLIAEAIKENKLFDLVFVDLKLGPENGGELARRLIDICKVNTVIITGHPEPATALPFGTNGCTIKPYNTATLSYFVQNNISPSRVSVDSPKLVLNLWEATRHLHGINSLKSFSSKMDQGRNVVKITGTAVRDKEAVNCTVYTQPDIEKKVINIGLSSTLGCTEACEFCINWRCRLNNKGKAVRFLRNLAPDEIIAQVYLAMISPQMEKAFLDKEYRVKINFTCEGDLVVGNLENGMIAIGQLMQIVMPEISVVITTSGDERNLDKYLKKYIDTPNVSFYWSLTTANEKVRNKLMPGQRRRSMEGIRDKFREIGQKTGRAVTVNLIVIPGLTDSQADANRVYDFLQDESGSDDPFMYKVMALNPDSLKGQTSPTTEEVAMFCQKLEKAGIDPKKIRTRLVRGSDIAAGCGDCAPDRGYE